jgi:syntaxin 5
LIIYVKDSVSEIQTAMSHIAKDDQEMQYSRQSAQSGDAIKEILNMRLMDVTKQFKQALQRHSETIRMNEQKKSRLAATSSSGHANKHDDVKTKSRIPRFKAESVKHGGGAGRNGAAMDLEQHGRGDAESDGGFVAQEYHERKQIEHRADLMKNIEKMMNEVATIFTRLGTMVKMHEVMIDR